MEEQYYTYIMSNAHNSVLYIGVTNDLKRRAFEHREKLAKGFTKKYNVAKLVYYEVFAGPVDAIQREKQLKGWPRARKIELIEGFNRDWDDLYDSI